MSKDYVPDYYHGDYPDKPKIQPWKTHPHAGKDLQFEKPKAVTVADLFPNLGRQTIGWSPLLEMLKEVTAAKPSYPPYDITKISDDGELLEVAIAGFTKEQLKVTVDNDVLTIAGKKPDVMDEFEVIHRGIASRDFELKFPLATYWKVAKASLNNGMLAVTLQREIPEEKKPKQIDIN